MGTATLLRQIRQLAQQRDRLPVDDPRRQPLRAAMRGKRARLAYRLDASAAAFEAYLARAAT